MSYRQKDFIFSILIMIVFMLCMDNRSEAVPCGASLCNNHGICDVFYMIINRSPHVNISCTCEPGWSGERCRRRRGTPIMIVDSTPIDGQKKPTTSEALSTTTPPGIVEATKYPPTSKRPNTKGLGRKSTFYSTLTSRITTVPSPIRVVHSTIDSSPSTTAMVDVTTTAASTEHTTTESLCTNGEMHLFDVFCGRGPNRQNCPSGFECNIHPTDKYAVCCPMTTTSTTTTTITTTTTTTTAITAHADPCEYVAVPKRTGWYRVKNSRWSRQMPCPSNLIFDNSLCRCTYQ